MGRTPISLLVGASLALATLVSLGAARAEPLRAVVVTTHERVHSTGPNRTLLRSGVWTLGISYVPALVVAIQSDRKGDDYLYYPVAGPWLDLANRERCSTCNHETLNDVLLVTDGVFQGIGALQILGAFMLPEHRTVYGTTRQARSTAPAPLPRPRLQLKAARVSSGYGVQATALF